VTGRARGNPTPDNPTLDVVIETPRGSHSKLKFEPERGAFRLSHVLPAGMAFPFDFGYVPDTIADDGDPLDVLVLLDAPVPPGCLVETRLVGVLEVEQREQDGAVVRNDRLLGVAVESMTRAGLRELDDLDSTLLAEIEAFFDQYNRLDGKAFRVLHRRGARAAADTVRRARVDR
jgi:inorganic pyrophosphatase